MSKKIAAVIGALLVGFLVVELVPLKTVAYTVTVDYQDTETYYEDEPYEAIETYSETVPLAYARVDAYLSSDIDWEGEGVVPSDVPVYPICHTSITNTDTVPGTFEVVFTFEVNYVRISGGSIRLWSDSFVGGETIYIRSGETKTVKHTFSQVDLNQLLRSDGFSWSCDVNPDTKEVEKERTVTKYREVEKQRTVTKQREETHYKKVTLLDYLLHYR